MRLLTTCPKAVRWRDRVAGKGNRHSEQDGGSPLDRVLPIADERRSKFNLRPVGWLSGRFKFSHWCVASSIGSTSTSSIKIWPWRLSSSAMLGAIFT